MPTHVSTALYSIAAIRDIEHTAMAPLPAGALMERAGSAAYRIALELLTHASSPAKILLLAGPGNNGGDALVTARLLAEAGQHPSVMLCAQSAQPEDAQHALEIARRAGVVFIEATSAAVAAGNWDLVVDGLFGIGLSRPITGALGELVQAVNGLSCSVLALDVPSGLDADTGQLIGETSLAVKATHTVTFLADKPGLHTGCGRDYAGEVRVADLEVEHSCLTPPVGQMNAVELFSQSLRKRPQASHKGSYGDVIVIGGAGGMAGAPILAARAALQCGAGRVFAAFLEAAPAYDGQHPELMCRLADEMDLASATLVAGPGLGDSRHAHDLLARVLHTHCPLVLDADALNLIAQEPGLQQILRQRSASVLMTPHPLEAARLLGSTTHDVQADRLAAARAVAQKFNTVVILKGSGSIIATADGELAINPTGNAGLATAGAGDVLSGICGAFMAQGFFPWRAALTATWIHGRAADVLVEQGVGPIGLTASELIPAARGILNQLTEDVGRISLS